MHFILKILLTALAAIIAAYILPGVYMAGFGTAIIVALVLALLNTFIKPLLIILTIPITLLTLGLFLLVINVIIIKLADYLVAGFSVSNWFYALLFSFIVSFFSSVLDKLVTRNDRRLKRY